MILKKDIYVIPKDLMEELVSVLEANQDDEYGDTIYSVSQVLDKLTNEVYKNESQ